MYRISTLVLLVGGILSCSEAPPEFHASTDPVRLSEWNLFTVNDGSIEANRHTLVFTPSNSLFSDYAQKLRTLWVPPGETIAVEDGRLKYPVGTVLSKSFFYPVAGDGRVELVANPATVPQLPKNDHRVLETRLLVRRTDGWEGLPYVWNDELTEAFLRIAGTSISISSTSQDSPRFTYFVPNQNQCAGCHTRVHPDGGLEPLGAVAHQLNASGPGGEMGQVTYLEAMNARGWLESVPDLPASVSWQDTKQPLEDRAVSYLDINCGHCHNPSGPADTSALLLDGFDRSLRDMGACKPPVAAGGGAGNRMYGIVPGQPEESILIYRMASTEPDEMMPELGRTLVHREGLRLVSDWIAAMPGGCN